MSWPSMGDRLFRRTDEGGLPGENDPPPIAALEIRFSFQECRAEENALPGFLKKASIYFKALDKNNTLLQMSY